MWNLLPALNLVLVDEAQGTAGLGGTTGPDLTRYFTVCVVLIAVTAAVAFGLRKLVAGNLKVRAAQRSLQVIDVLGLGGKRKLAVVRCYDRTFLVGLGDRELSAIAELDPVIGATEPQATPKPADRAAFAQALESVRKSMPEKAPAKGVLPVKPTAAPAQERTVIVKRRKVKTKSVATGERDIPSQAAQSQRVKKPVRAVAENDRSARERDAREVASAALDLAQAKKRALAQQSSKPSAEVARPSAAVGGLQKEGARVSATPKGSAPERFEAPDNQQIMSLEGILG